MILDVRILSYFLAVANAGSLSRAARELRIAQPSLSRQLRRLESDLGVELVRRVPGGVRLTAAGSLLLPMAQDILARAEAAETRMRTMADAPVGGFRVVAPVTTIVDVIAPYLAASGPSGPLVTAHDEVPASVFSWLERGDADVAVSSGSPPDGFASRGVFRFPVWAYPPARHRWARRRAARVDLDELVREPLIVLGTGHGTRRVLDLALAGHGLTYRRAFEADRSEIALALAASDHGVAVVSDDPQFGLRPLAIMGSDGPLRIPLVAAWDASHHAAQAISTWVDGLARFCSQRYGDLSTGSRGSGRSQPYPTTAMTSISTTMSR